MPRIDRDTRVKLVDDLIRQRGPMGCKELATALNCCRATVQQTVTPLLGARFKIVQEATDGPYGKEALYDVLDSERPSVEEVVETRLECHALLEAQSVIVRAMYAMILT